MSASAIDRATFDALKETTGAEFVHELADTFRHEAPKMLAELREALTVRDSERFRRAAHSLKSNSNTFGALTLAAIARELELAGIAKVIEDHGRRLDALDEEYARVAAALAELRDA